MYVSLRVHAFVYDRGRIAGSIVRSARRVLRDQDRAQLQDIQERCTLYSQEDDALMWMAAQSLDDVTPSFQ